jgi:hypothetical protein
MVVFISFLTSKICSSLSSSVWRSFPSVSETPNIPLSRNPKNQLFCCSLSLNFDTRNQSPNSLVFWTENRRNFGSVISFHQIHQYEISDHQETKRQSKEIWRRKTMLWKKGISFLFSGRIPSALSLNHY